MYGKLRNWLSTYDFDLKTMYPADEMPADKDAADSYVSGYGILVQAAVLNGQADWPSGFMYPVSMGLQAMKEAKDKCPDVDNRDFDELNEEIQALCADDDLTDKDRRELVSASILNNDFRTERPAYPFIVPLCHNDVMSVFYNGKTDHEVYDGFKIYADKMAHSVADQWTLENDEFESKADRHSFAEYMKSYAQTDIRGRYEYLMTHTSVRPGKYMEDGHREECENGAMVASWKYERGDAFSNGRTIPDEWKEMAADNVVRNNNDMDYGE